MFSGYGPPIIPPGAPPLTDYPLEKPPKPGWIKRFFRWMARLIRRAE